MKGFVSSEPTYATEVSERDGDPVPYMGVHDNNRGYHRPLQAKNKIFQSPEERFNNPVTSNTGVTYDSGSTVPFNINGPYHY